MVIVKEEYLEDPEDFFGVGSYYIKYFAIFDSSDIGSKELQLYCTDKTKPCWVADSITGLRNLLNQKRWKVTVHHVDKNKKSPFYCYPPKLYTENPVYKYPMQYRYIAFEQTPKDILRGILNYD